MTHETYEEQDYSFPVLTRPEPFESISTKRIEPAALYRAALELAFQDDGFDIESQQFMATLTNGELDQVAGYVGEIRVRARAAEDRLKAMMPKRTPGRQKKIKVEPEPLEHVRVVVQRDPAPQPKSDEPVEAVPFLLTKEEVADVTTSALAEIDACLGLEVKPALTAMASEVQHQIVEVAASQADPVTEAEAVPVEAASAKVSARHYVPPMTAPRPRPVESVQETPDMAIKVDAVKKIEGYQLRVTAGDKTVVFVWNERLKSTTILGAIGNIGVLIADAIRPLMNPWAGETHEMAFHRVARQVDSIGSLAQLSQLADVVKA